MQSITKHLGLSPQTGEPIAIETADGLIVSVSAAPSEQPEHWIAPGMIDLQVNGFAGVDYNSPETSADEISRSIEVQRGAGVTRLLPTVITGSNENMRGSLANLARAKRELANGSSLWGFHVEGPWISPLDGPRGAHPKEHVRPPTVDEFKQFQDAAEGQVRLVTVAPEIAGSMPVIEHMVDAGVVVSIGHTNASEQDIDDAISAGATMSTHLGNGAHQMIERHSNYITFQMARDELSAGLIVDGIHLPAAFVKVAVRAKGLDKSILTTDAVAPAGCKPGVYRLGHLEVRLSDDGSVRLSDTGRLAGSALRMDVGLGNLIRFAEISLYEALRMATVNPAGELNMEDRTGFLTTGDPAELVLFELVDGEVKVLETVVG
jgi:N-acetylglucosamine-6-phosphate deacetylase